MQENNIIQISGDDSVLSTLYKESKAFAARGLLNDRISSWEILLLNIYTKKQI